jgi:hypothetical protein
VPLSSPPWTLAHQQERRRRRRELLGLGARRGRVHQPLHRRPQIREALLGHVLGASGDRVPDRPALHGRRGGVRDDHVAVRVHGVEVGVGLGGRDLPDTEREAEDLRRRPNVAAEHRRREDRMALGLGDDGR